MNRLTSFGLGAAVALLAVLAARAFGAWYSPTLYTPQYARCPTPWVDAQTGDGRIVGAVCYVDGKPARLVVFR